MLHNQFSFVVVLILFDSFWENPLYHCMITNNHFYFLFNKRPPNSSLYQVPLFFNLGNQEKRNEKKLAEVSLNLADLMSSFLLIFCLLKCGTYSTISFQDFHKKKLSIYWISIRETTIISILYTQKFLLGSGIVLFSHYL